MRPLFAANGYFSIYFDDSMVLDSGSVLGDCLCALRIGRGFGA